MIDVAETVTGDLLRRFDAAVPRYISHPTADRYVEAFEMDGYRRDALGLVSRQSIDHGV